MGLKDPLPRGVKKHTSCFDRIVYLHRQPEVRPLSRYTEHTHFTDIRSKIHLSQLYPQTQDKLMSFVSCR